MHQRKEYPSRDDLDETNAESVKEELGILLGITESILIPDFKRLGLTYTCPKLVIADRNTLSEDNKRMSEYGPAYHSDERRIYIDPTYYAKELTRVQPDIRKATIAYNIFHEVAHHVQQLRGDDARELSKRMRIPYRLALVAVELQADCIAGMITNIAHRRDGLLDKGDKENMVKSAWAIGDDIIDIRMGKTFIPQFMTHGTGAMRSYAMQEGLKIVSLRDVPPVESFARYALLTSKMPVNQWYFPL